MLNCRFNFCYINAKIFFLDDP